MLELDDDTSAKLSEQSAVATLGYYLSGDTVLRASVGAVLNGELERSSAHYDLDPGWLVVLGASTRWRLGDGRRWFATGSVTAGVSATSTAAPDGARADLRAWDLRVGGAAGATLADRFSPYLLARVFGGPVEWSVDGDDVLGTDRYHVQLGAGMSVALPAGVSALVDLSALGERSASLGASVVF